MNILHVIGTLDAATGGPPVVVACLSAAQERLGHAVRIACCPPGGGEEAEHKLLAGVPGGDRLAIRHVPDSHGLDRFLGRAARDAISPLIQDSDIVHLHGVWEAVLVAAARTAKRLAKPYIVAPHGMLDPWNLRHGRLKKRAAMLLGFSEMLRGAAFLHTLNPDEARLIEPLKLGGRVRIIPNGVFLEEIDPLPEPGRFRAARPELGDDPFILFLSRLHHKKGLDYLAEAFARVAKSHTNIRLVVAGPDDGAQQDFEQLVRASGLNDRVHLVGPIYGKAKYEALVDACCFCLPSRQEGFSMALTEALACGTPVVASENCHFPEIQEAQAGRIVPLDALRVAEALREIIDDPGLATRMGRNGVALVRSRYTWSKIAQQTIDAYAQVLSDKL